MRLSAPRIAPLSDAELTPEQAEAVEPLQPTPCNIFRTFAHRPKALRHYIPWVNYVMSGQDDLPPRVREIVILRTGFLCKSGYEWAWHVIVGMREGLTEREIARIKHGAEAGWQPSDAAAIRAADELHRDYFISDEVWAELRQHYSQNQCMDIVFTAAQYTQISMFLNTFGVQLDEGLTLDRDLKGF